MTNFRRTKNRKLICLVLIFFNKQHRDIKRLCVVHVNNVHPI